MSYLPSFLEIYVAYLGVVAWAVWLTRRPTTPGFVRWIPYACGTVVAIGQGMALVAVAAAGAPGLPTMNAARAVAVVGVVGGVVASLAGTVVRVPSTPDPVQDRIPSQEDVS